MKLVEDTYHSNDSCRVFRWMKGTTEVAVIHLFTSEGLLEFRSEQSGPVAIENIGTDDESIAIDQMVIKVGTVKV